MGMGRHLREQLLEHDNFSNYEMQFEERLRLHEEHIQDERDFFVELFAEVYDIPYEEMAQKLNKKA